MNSPATSPVERQYYVDWLRILAVALLVPFHTAMIFVYWGFHIKNPERSLALTEFNSFLNVWHMPLLLVLSGAGTWFALAFRAAGEYARERFLRLFVPLAFGVLVIIPPQTYCQRIQAGQFEGSFAAFYPHVFNGIYPEGNFTWNHLWFLAYLFAYSLVALPFLVRFHGARGQQLREALAAFFEPRGRLLLLAIPLMLGTPLFLVFDVQQDFVHDWARHVCHFWAFLAGFVVFSHPKYAAALSRDRRIYLILGVITYVVIKGPDWMGWKIENVAVGIAGLAIRGLATWCWVVTFLGYGRLFLNRTNRVLKYATEAALPFYILHQTVIIVIGYYVVQWSWGVWPKFLFILPTSFLAILVIYDVLVRRLFFVRPLFGMRRNLRFR